MVGSSKILTVSYGTFSCTLEGFDDPFSTMRSIAEYFRDLAADDRYFGAEPPTPDAEMLHRIAQREVQRRVEAQVSDTGIVLRQSGDEAGPEDAGHTPARLTPGTKAPSVHPLSRPAAVAPTDKLDRIRAVVERARSRPSSARAWRAPSERAGAAHSDDDIAESNGWDADEVLAFDDLAAGDADALESMRGGAQTENGEQEATASDEVAPGREDEREDRDEDSRADVVAPLLSGISGVGAATETPEGADDEAQAEVAGVSTEDAGTPMEDEDEAAAGTPGTAEEGPAGADEDDSRIVARVGSELAQAGESGTAEDAPDADADEDLAERIIRLSRAGEQSRLLSDDDEDNAGTDGPATAPGLHGRFDADAADRKEKRRSVLIGRDPDREPAFKRILEETNSKMADREGTRRRSAIAHLKAAVQATKADRMLKRERSRQVDAEEQSAYREDLAKVVRPQTSESAEAAAARIVAESRAEGAEPAPLVLMSSQRIDPAKAETEAGKRHADAGPEDAGAADIENMYDDDYEAFAEFASEAGATGITDLLEAAAAFTAYVSEQPHFSRPQIMRLAAAATTDEDFTREAGLRSFGQLLRQGRIRKLQRGQFAVSGNTRFRPGARIAGE